jgi:hypothetical protein
MQKIIILILAIFSSGLVFNMGYAVDTTTLAGVEQASQSTTSTPSSSSSPNKIFTSESVPGANCKCVTKGSEKEGSCGSEVKVSDRKYECTVPTGLAGFQSVFAQVIRFVINIVLLLGVLSVVALGIAWSFAGGDDVKAKSSLKKWAINIIMGLVILFFFRYILMLLAPWVYQ